MAECYEHLFAKVFERSFLNFGSKEINKKMSFRRRAGGYHLIVLMELTKTIVDFAIDHKWDWFHNP
jgi:hypothetical protein